MERLCQDPNAAGVLRSACWAQRGQTHRQHQERRITWRVYEDKLTTEFTGGIILIQNKPLDRVPELKALKTRIPHLHLQPSAEEIIAKMRSIALEGYQHGEDTLTVEQCQEVCDHVVRQCQASQRMPDMRMLVNGFHDRLQHEAQHSETDWRDMVDSYLKEQVITPAYTESRADRLARERTIAVEINGMHITSQEKERLFTERTQKSGRAFYRRLNGDRTS